MLCVQRLVIHVRFERYHGLERGQGGRRDVATREYLKQSLAQLVATLGVATLSVRPNATATGISVIRGHDLIESYPLWPLAAIIVKLLKTQLSGRPCLILTLSLVAHTLSPVPIAQTSALAPATRTCEYISAYILALAREFANICRKMRGRFVMSSQKCPRPEGIS